MFDYITCNLRLTASIFHQPFHTASSKFIGNVRSTSKQLPRLCGYQFLSMYTNSPPGKARMYSITRPSLEDGLRDCCGKRRGKSLLTWTQMLKKYRGFYFLEPFPLHNTCKFLNRNREGTVSISQCQQLWKTSFTKMPRSRRR